MDERRLSEQAQNLYENICFRWSTSSPGQMIDLVITPILKVWLTEAFEAGRKAAASTTEP